MQQLITTIPQHDFRRFLNDLHSANNVVEQHVKERIAKLTAIDLLTLIRMEMQRGRGVRNREVSGKVLAGAAVIVAIVAVVIVLGLLTNGAAVEGCGYGCTGIGDIDLPGREVRTPELEYLATTLALVPDEDSTCVMLEAASMSDFLSGWLGSTLDDKLLETRAEDAVRWSPVHQRLLLRRLKKGGGKRALLAVLHALGYVGSPEAIVPVYRLVREKDPEISTAAERCRVLLQQRARSMSQERELLRSSVRPSATAQDLLRAGSSGGDARSAEMLRAAPDYLQEKHQRIC